MSRKRGNSLSTHDTETPAGVSAETKTRAPKGSSLSRPDDQRAPYQIFVRGDVERGIRSLAPVLGMTPAQAAERALGEWLERNRVK